MSRRGFTLVETVVVVAVCAALAAILVPALRAASGAARTVACTSNLRQLATAAHAYAAANGAMPAAVLYRRDNGAEVSTLDLCGHGRFTLLTGLGGEAWATAAAEVGAELGIDLASHIIGPRQTYIDHSGDWARASEIRDSGCLLVRPDHHICWRAETLSASPRADLLRVLRSILAR